jgi:hypothetical protein
MNVKSSVRWSRSVVWLIVGLAVLMGPLWASAQDQETPAWHEDYEGQDVTRWLYQAARDGMAADGELRAAVLARLRDLVGPHDVPYCAWLAGTGGGAYLDGGGGGAYLDGGGTVLAPKPLSVSDMVLRPPPETVADALGTNHVVIVDAFHLQEIANALAVGWDDEVDDAQAWEERIASMTVAAGFLEVDGRYVVPHGHVVLYHTLRLAYPAAGGPINAVIVNGVDGGEPTRIELEVGLKGDPTATLRITLVPITFDDIETIKDAMALTSGGDYADAAVVTSWALTDCALAQGYLTAQGLDETPRTLTQYLARLVFGDANDAEAEASEDLIVALCEAFRPFMPDPSLVCSNYVLLLAYLAALEIEAATVIGWDIDGRVPYGRVFAASGNQGLPYPMPPAAWPGVYGVSACGDSDVAKAVWANFGDFLVFEHVSAAGAWFSVPSLDGLATEQLGYWGTSFAAPHAALTLGVTGSPTTVPHGISPCSPPTPLP